MTNQELERRLADAIVRTAPNDLEGVLSHCEMRKGNVIQMTTRKKKPMIRNLIAACLALALVGGGGAVYQQTCAVASIVSLDVNPSIELEINKNEKVLTCAALNEEAVKVLAGMNGGADLKGTKLDVAVNAIVGALVRSGYLDSISSAILISVEDKDQTRAAKLQQELIAAVDVVLQEKASDAAVLSQTVAKDSALEKQAKENNISTGKASLITRVIALNSSLKFDELAALSVEELKDLIDTGAPGMPIGQDEAVLKASIYAGVAHLSSTRWEVDAELDDAIPHYDVELYTSAGEFEYEVDAYTGTVLRGRADVLSTPSDIPSPVVSAQPVPSVSPGTVETPAVTTPAPQPSAETGEMIGKTSAFDIAVENFRAKYPELRGDSILNDKVSLDRDDGKVHYDVEFFVGGYEVDYEIDAYTGSVLSWDTDYEGPRTKTETPAAADIGKDKAVSIALAHAGLTESQTTWIQVEKDEDDGRIEYEIDFKADGMEYEYTIDAASGTVLEHEKERDD